MGVTFVLGILDIFQGFSDSWPQLMNNLKRMIYSWTPFNGYCASGIIFLFIIGILDITCYLTLDLIWGLWWSNFWYPFSSGVGVTVNSSRSWRVNRIWNSSAYKNFYLLRDTFKTRYCLIFSFPPWRDIYFTWFSRRCWGLKLGVG